MSECADLCQWLNRSNADLTTMSCTGIARGLSLYFNLCNATSALLKKRSIIQICLSENWFGLIGWVDSRLNNGRPKHPLQVWSFWKTNVSHFRSKWPTLRHLNLKCLFASFLQFLSLNPFCLLCNSHFWLRKRLKAKNNSRTCSYVAGTF